MSGAVLKCGKFLGVRAGIMIYCSKPVQPGNKHCHAHDEQLIAKRCAETADRDRKAKAYDRLVEWLDHIGGTADLLPEDVRAVLEKE